MTTRLTLTRPDDWHLHLRDGALLNTVVPESARHFVRALIMPNLVPPVVTVKDAESYHSRIRAALPRDTEFTPLMTLYLTEATQPSDIRAAYQSGIVRAVKLYPAGATTNSASGVRNLENVHAVLETMAELGLHLCVHGEVTDPDVDIFDREAVFLDRVLDPIRRATPDLKVTLEHITTVDGIAYVQEGGANIAGTITTHHLMINRNHMLVGGIRPHYYCLPVVKRRTHQEALRKAATSGDAKFFLGTDSAPHPDSAKETACGCAGCFTATNTLSCLAHVFEEEGALDRLEAFTSTNGAQHYGLPINTGQITLIKQDTPVSYPEKLTVEGETVTVFDPGHPLYWSVAP